jgi:hypothetical protein
MTVAKTSLEIASNIDVPILWAEGEGFGLGVWLALIGAGLVGLVVELVRFTLRARRATVRANQARRIGQENQVEQFPDGVAPMALSPREPNLRGDRYAQYVGPFHREDGTPPGPPLPWG